MTKEEAKEVFLNRGYIKVDGGTLYSPDKWREACVVISEWLEQELCEDVVSREKAKQFLYERIDRLNDDELYDIFSRIIDDMYNELPSVTPQPFINKPCVSEGVCREDKVQVLDKIKAEIDRQEKWLMDAGCNTYNVDIALSAIKLAVAESEVNNG